MSGLWRVLVILSALLALAGLGAAGWYGYSWYNASAGTSAEAVDARDGALKAARQLAATLQTINPTRPDEGLDAWEAAATGDLLVQLRRDRGKNLDQIKKSPTTGSASVVETALTDLNVSAGTATAITAVDVTQSTLVNDTPGPPTVRQLRVRLTLKLTDAGWKASSTGLVQAKA
jgi:Mce-associated membrane protein